MPRILISNDDGVYAPGLAVLADALSQIADVLVVAPDRDHSGASNSLTLSRPLSVERLDNGFYKCDGTPTDCVHLGLRLFKDHAPDFVVSGINAGPNLGDDVLYSGTVAAAMEGRFLGMPALAVSLEKRDQWHFETAAHWACDVIQHLPNLAPGRVLNLNVPGVPLDQVEGLEVTRLGHRTMGADPIRVADPRGKERLWLSLAGDALDAGEGTDFNAVRNNRVSLTPVQPDMTAYGALDELAALWH
ncbi:MAG: 5'/3'-nucleotidase SurE [Litorivicinus sp.]